MPTVFVARSAALCKWASDVGLGKNVFKVGIVDDKEALKDIAVFGWSGESDWKVVASRDVDDLAEPELLERLGRREKSIDPDYYPHIKGTHGLFRVNQINVINAMLVTQAMSSADEPLKAPKPKAKDFADYILKIILG